MSKAIAGAAMIAGVLIASVAIPGMGALLFTAAAPYIIGAMSAVAAAGISMEAGAIAEALTSNRGQNITTRMAAGLRQIIYGMQRVGGTMVYQSTSGNSFWQMNMIIVIATHEIDSIENLYLDGRQVYWNVGSTGNTNRNGVNFGGDADHNDHIGPGGPTYNFGTLVYCEARFGDQADGDVIAAVAGNDPSWSTSALGNPPYLGGCAYVYLKVVYHSVTTPSLPEIKFTVNGKNDIYDPRTNTKGYTQNWALIVADAITDPNWGLGDNSVNQAQLIAAANVCDEQIETSQGFESNYSMSIHYDTSTSPGDALNMMMPAGKGRLSRIGGEWYIWPGYFQSSSFSFDESALVAEPTWTPYRSFKDLFNRVNGTYTAANFPYNTAGNLYDSNGWWNGTTANNWPYAFQPTNYPQYAQDALHGYPTDPWLTEDTPTQPAWSASITYKYRDLVSYGGLNYQSLIVGNIGFTPSSSPGEWEVWWNVLPTEVIQRGVLSIVQSQRLAKIHLLQNRYQGTGTLTMSLAAWQMIPTSVFEFTWSALNWVDKMLEVSAVRFQIEELGGESGGNDSGEDDEKVPALTVVISFNETGPEVYEWSIAEELTPYDVPVAPVNNAYTPQPPGSLTLASSAGTAITGLDGVVIPRVQVSWTSPPDSYVTQIQVQYKLHSSLIWIDAGSVVVGLLSTYVVGVVSGQVYDFRIRSLRFNGATSVWVEDDSYTVSTVLSSISVANITGLSGAALGDASSLSTGTLAAARLPTALIRLNAAGASGSTVAPGAVAQVGTGATATAAGSALSGSITLDTGTGTLAGGDICVLTFPSALAAAPQGVCAMNGNAIIDLEWVATTTTLTLSVTSPLAPSTTYKIGYSMS
jgi:hypothetical protein